MKTTKSQFGFIASHVLLLLVIIGIICFAGWKVYDASKSAQQLAAATSKPTASSPALIPKTNTITSTLEKFSLTYPSDWKPDMVELAKTRTTGSTPDERIKLISPAGTEFWYASEEEDPSFPYQGQKYGCGGNSYCAVIVVNEIQDIQIKNIGTVQLLKIGTNKKGSLDQKHHYEPGYSIELTVPESDAVKLKVGENSFPDYSVSYNIKGNGNDRVNFSIKFPDNYTTKTPEEVFSSSEAKTAVDILKSIRFE